MITYKEWIGGGVFYAEQITIALLKSWISL